MLVTVGNVTELGKNMIECNDAVSLCVYALAVKRPDVYTAG